MKFIDIATIFIKSGDGGAGHISFRKEKFVPKGGPDGGNGGRGGNVIIKADHHMNTLLDFKYKRHYKASDGNPGEKSRRTGKDAKDIIIKVPTGTLIKKTATDEVLFDLTEAGQEVIVAKGGKGGRGNAEFATATNQAPRYALHQSGKQLVLTSDVSPKELSDVDERLISRFQWGLTVDIQQPDIEMRMAILKKKSENEGIELTNDIIEYLAKHITHSIRELEGALISLIAKFTLDRKPLNLDLAKEVVGGLTVSSENKTINIDYIKRTVADYFKVSFEELASVSRRHEIALPRQMSMYFAKLLTQSSLKTIGSHFGNRDHSTVLHSCKAIENYLVTDKNVKQMYETLLKKIRPD